jgi:putative transposase
MASHPGKWSSYRINAEGKASHLIAPRGPDVRLGRGLDTRREAYRGLFREASDDAVVNEIRAATTSGFVLGAARFQEQIAAQLGRRVTPAKPARHRARTPSAPALGRTVSKPGPGAMAAVDAKAAT